MLNIGQVVLDLDRNEVMIFAGLEILQDQKTGECTAYTAYITRDGKYISGKSDDIRRNYTNFVRDKSGNPPYGSFIDEVGLIGHYFGVLDNDKMTKKHFDSAVKAIKEFEDRGWTMNEEGKPVLNEAAETAA